MTPLRELFEQAQQIIDQSSELRRQYREQAQPLSDQANELFDEFDRRMEKGLCEETRKKVQSIMADLTDSFVSKEPADDEL